MKSNPNKKGSRINVVTLGCSKNLWDSEMLLGQLAGNEINAVHQGEHAKSDTVVINTCGFIDNAKQESIDTILEYADAKNRGEIKNLVVMGCLSERYKADLQDEIPEVDAYFGSNQMPDILRYFEADYKHELVGERLLTTPSHYAYFKIAEGCDRPCSFCAIPIMRGKHRSFTEESLIAQAKSLAAKGTKELILIAQDLTYYGLDLHKKRTLPDLLRKLSDVEGIEWIRLQYAYPSGFPLDIIRAMKERDNICNYLDMPLQHISDNLLKNMRRGISKDKTIRLIDDIRDIIPEITLRTTMLVGHPGETAYDHEELLDFVTKSRFDRLGVFTYSHEENTHSGSMMDDVHPELKEQRAGEVMDIQREISLEKNAKQVGQTLRVLIDRVEGDHFVGRTEGDSPEVDNEVLIPVIDKPLSIGSFYNVFIKDALDYDLLGSVE